MKFQYFLRGLGAGIVFAAIIFVIAYNSKGTDISDEEVIRRARNLGMIEADDQVGKLLAKEDNSEENVTTTEASTQNTTTESKTSSEATTQEKNTDEKTTEKITTEELTEEATTQQQEYELVVTHGMSSFPVCQKLEALGLIKDAADFDDYLIENGYASKISVGTHILKKGMTYKQIAIAISDK